MQGDRQDGSGQLVAGIELQHPFERARRALALSLPRIDQTSVDLDAEGERIESVRALDLGYCVRIAARGLVEIRPVLYSVSVEPLMFTKGSTATDRAGASSGGTPVSPRDRTSQPEPMPRIRMRTTSTTSARIQRCRPCIP